MEVKQYTKVLVWDLNKCPECRGFLYSFIYITRVGLASLTYGVYYRNDRFNIHHSEAKCLPICHNCHNRLQSRCRNHPSHTNSIPVIKAPHTLECQVCINQNFLAPSSYAQILDQVPTCLQYSICHTPIPRMAQFILTCNRSSTLRHLVN